MKHLFFAVLLLSLLCSCAHEVKPKPLYASRFYAEKDSFVPNGWRYVEDGFYMKPESFDLSPHFALDESNDEYDERANLFTVKTGDKPTLYDYVGLYEVEDDSIIEVSADAAGRGSFSLGVVLFDSECELIGERHQGFNLQPATGDKPFKNYVYRLYFLANENSKARFVRLMFITDPSSTLTLRTISLNITPFEIDRKDSNYNKMKELEAKYNR